MPTHQAKALRLLDTTNKVMAWEMGGETEWMNEKSIGLRVDSCILKVSMIYTTLKAQGEVICDGMAALVRNSYTAEMSATWLLTTVLSAVNFYNVKEGSQTGISQ